MSYLYGAGLSYLGSASALEQIKLSACASLSSMNSVGLWRRVWQIRSGVGDVMDSVAEAPYFGFKDLHRTPGKLPVPAPRHPSLHEGTRDSGDSGNNVSVSRATWADADTRPNDRQALSVVVVMDLSDGDFSGWRRLFTPLLNSSTYYYSVSFLLGTMGSGLSLGPEEIRLPAPVSWLCLHSGHTLHTGRKSVVGCEDTSAIQGPTWEQDTHQMAEDPCFQAVDGRAGGALAALRQSQFAFRYDKIGRLANHVRLCQVGMTAGKWATPFSRVRVRQEMSIATGRPA